MQRLSLAILLAACTSSMPSPVDDNPVVDTTQMTCSTSVKDYCAGNACDQSLAAAQQDKRLCPASEMVCAQFHVVMKTATDSATNFFYQDGQLVAIESMQQSTLHN